jgi:hypothetical protein
MEGTGHFGAGLLRFLADYGLAVVEVDRPGASPAAGTANPTRWMPNPLPAPCNPGGLLAPRNPAMPRWEMIRVLRVARKGAMKARIQADAQIDAVILAAPEPVRAQFRKLSPRQRIRAAAALRPDRCMTRRPRPKWRCVRWPAAGRPCNRDRRPGHPAHPPGHHAGPAAGRAAGRRS